jgi:hypothetical protein
MVIWRALRLQQNPDTLAIRQPLHSGISTYLIPAGRVELWQQHHRVGPVFTLVREQQRCVHALADYRGRHTRAYKDRLPSCCASESHSALAAWVYELAVVELVLPLAATVSAETHTRAVSSRWNAVRLSALKPRHDHQHCDCPHSGGLWWRTPWAAAQRRYPQQSRERTRRRGAS